VIVSPCSRLSFLPVGRDVEHLPFLFEEGRGEDLFLDCHRQLRSGYPEQLFGVPVAKAEAAVRTGFAESSGAACREMHSPVG